MKRILSVVLAVCLVFALSVSALAADSLPNGSTSADGSATATVTATVTGSTTADPTVNHRYYVTVEWTDIAVAASNTTTGAVYTWNGSTYTKDSDSSTTQTLTDAAISVTVVNKSDLKINAAVSYAASSQGESVTWTSASAEIPTVVDTSATDYLTKTYSDFASATQEFNGTVAKGSSDLTAGSLGTITVTISAAAA